MKREPSGTSSTRYYSVVPPIRRIGSRAGKPRIRCARCLVRFPPEEERAVAAFDDQNLMTREEAIHHLLVEQILLRELGNGEASGAASRRPRVASWRGAAHWACT